MPHDGVVSALWLIAAAPVVVLSGLGLFGHVPGEWGRAALLAYAAVLLGCLGGMILAAQPPGDWTGRLAAGTAVAIGFAGLSLGGAAGHGAVAAGHAIFVVFALLRAEAGLPWPLAAATAAAGVLAALRSQP